MTWRRRPRALALLFLLALALAACGNADDGAGVRTIDGEGESSSGSSEAGSGSGASGSGSGGSGSATAESEAEGGSGSASSAAAGSGSGTAAACMPVGEGGGTPVEVVLAEWSVTPEPAEVQAGAVTFTAANAGAEVHELVVVAAGSADELTVVDGQVDEEALPEGAFVGEVEGFGAGEACDGTFDLPAGDYVLFCNILETEADGARESHYEEGMVTEFSVV